MTALERPPRPTDDGAERRVKELFRSDAYADVFNPEDATNPFRTLYAEKLFHVVDLLRGRGGTLVDLGGGPGRISSALAAERAPGRTVVHLDLSGEMVRRARRRAGDLPVRHAVADAERPPLPPRSADALIALDLYCHLPNPRAFLANAHAALRDDGWLVIDNSNARAWWMFAYPGYLHPRWHARRFWSAFLHGGVPPAWRGRVRHYRRGTFERHLRAAGFLVERRRDFGPKYCPKWHLIVARKAHRDVD